MPIEMSIRNPAPQTGKSIAEIAWAESVKLFLLDCKFRNLASTTIDYYKFHLIGLERFLEHDNLTLAQLTPTHLQQSMMNYFIDKKLAPNTIRGRIASGHAFFEYLWQEKMLRINLAEALTIPKRLSQGIFTFSEDQVHAILQQPDQTTFTGFRDYVIMLVFLETGLRVVELANMTLSDIQFSEETIRIPLGKGRKPRVVPIQKTCMKALQAYIHERDVLPIDHVWVTVENGPLTRASIVKSVRAYCAQANIKGTRGSCHTFRHTMAKAYLLNGGDVFTLMHILGHTSIEMTKKYVDLFNEDIHKQHQKASPIEFVMAPDSPKESEGEDA